MLGYADGSYVVVAVCPKHRDQIRDTMAAQGVPVSSAERLN